MATSLKVNELTMKFNGSYRATNDYGSKAAKFDHDWAIALTNGTGAGSANFAYQDQITITATSNNAFDLYGGMTDEFGTAIVPSTLKLVAIRLNTSTDTAATISIGNGASNQWISAIEGTNDLVKVRLGGWVVFACTDATGYAVSNTNKTLKILNNSATQSVTVDLVVVGVK